MNLFKLAPAALVALAACATDAQVDSVNDSTESVATEAAPPPGAGGLTMTVDGILEPGTQVRWLIQGAAANAQIYLVRGTAESAGSFCPPVLGGLCVDVRNPQLLTTLRADANGNAQFTANIPNLPDLTAVYFQAATGGAGAATSNVVGKWNPNPDQSGEARLFLANLATVAPGNYTGIQIEQYYSYAVQEMDVCTLVADVTGTSVAPLAPCAGCDFAFNLTHDNYVDETISGDCLGLMGIDVATITAWQSGNGYDANYIYNGAPINAMMIYDDTTGTWVAGAYAQFTAPDFLWAVDLPQPGYIYVY
jgi:hypothetical protein